MATGQKKRMAYQRTRRSAKQRQQRTRQRRIGMAIAGLIVTLLVLWLVAATSTAVHTAIETGAAAGLLWGGAILIGGAGAIILAYSLFGRRPTSPTRSVQPIRVAHISPIPAMAPPPIAPAAPSFSTITSEEQMRSLTSSGFEEYVAHLFRTKGGYDAKRVGGSGDGGVDIRLMKDGQKAIVSCKKYRDYVSPDHIRALLGTMRLEGVDRAFLVTTGRVSTEAHGTIFGTGITIIEGKHLLHWVHGVADPLHRT